ncbi:uncharacterized protein DFL_000494 [Arthrobotrys flagrans]|uniref:Uncharacterized protein n=1 Tax=Arthrobotrys flagrans TaxID=97331 RepID=A0A437ADY2_ARTFL|nr:hypothetical protein DFL_000494 [Arthrobotrys flagrans]
MAPKCRYYRFCYRYIIRNRHQLQEVNHEMVKSLAENEWVQKNFYITDVVSDRGIWQKRQHPRSRNYYSNENHYGRRS